MADSPDEPPKDIRTRIQENREKYETALEIKNHVYAWSKGGGIINPERLRALREADFNIKHPPSQKKAETVQRSQTQLHGPPMPPRTDSQSPVDSPLPIDFYCWKEGKAGTIKLGAVSDFVEDS